MSKYEIPPNANILTNRAMFRNVRYGCPSSLCAFQVWDPASHALAYCGEPTSGTLRLDPKSKPRNSSEISLCAEHHAFLVDARYPLEAQYPLQLKACREAKARTKGKAPRSPRVCPHCGGPI